MNQPKKKNGQFSKTHGMFRAPVYIVWTHMKSRCTNPNNKRYPHYGGKGVKICDRWLGPDGFLNFYADMGDRPAGMTMDRINNDGNYEPGNCRWATARQQAENTTQVKIIEFNGEAMSKARWAEKLGIDRASLNYRLRKWPIEKALSDEKHPGLALKNRDAAIDAALDRGRE